MPKRTGDDDDTVIHASTPKLQRKESTNTNSTEDEFDEDNDCIVVPSAGSRKFTTCLTNIKL